MSHLGVEARSQGKQRNTQIHVYLPVTYVLWGISSKAKTLGFTRVYTHGASRILTRTLPSS